MTQFLFQIPLNTEPSDRSDKNDLLYFCIHKPFSFLLYFLHCCYKPKQSLDRIDLKCIGFIGDLWKSYFIQIKKEDSFFTSDFLWNNVH